jgi:hypothetical protein
MIFVVSDAWILRIPYTVSHVRPQMRLKKDHKQPQADTSASAYDHLSAIKVRLEALQLVISLP